MNYQVIIAIIISFIIGIYFSFRTSKLKQNAQQYFTGKGLLNKNLIFFSVFATAFSAFTVIGLPAMFLTQGIGTLLFMGVGIILTPFTLHFIGRKIIRLSNSNVKYSTPVGLLSSGYNSRAITIILSTLTILVLFPYFVLQIAGVGKFLLSVSNGNISYLLGCVICCLIVTPYIYTGGAKADADTDRIQGIILIACAIVIGSVIIIFAINNNFSAQIDVLKSKGLLSLPGPKNYFSFELLLSYAVIFTLISISTPQVSQKLMGIKDEKQLAPLLRVYPFVGIIIVIFAGLMGFYAAANLTVSSPDFVSGDVIRSLADKFSGSFLSFLFIFVSVLFISGVISAAVSTIDSLILTITGIIKDEVTTDKNETGKSLKMVSVLIVIIGIISATKPPLFIVSLAQIQLSGLTGLLPCLLGSNYGFANKLSGWLSLLLGILPVVLNKAIGLTFGKWEIGIVALLAGIVGLVIGKLLNGR